MSSGDCAVASEYSPLVICDAGPLIHLDELAALDLLADFSEVCVPDAVWKEVLRNRPSALRSRHLSLHRVDLIPDVSPELESLIRNLPLGVGEEEALRLMQQFADATLLTDDSVARLVARRMGYDVHGSIGILVRAIALRQRSKIQVLRLLRAIPVRSTLFVKRSLLKSIVDHVQEKL